ncbi:nose resistant to fluoxetine protein 6-like [Anticarsia gemmatalis]|uniref:nose resistant to fluoxetine protein 6-like n=1 Tax=Anticarsia gemmatalis TaxID=129554 RepID=UPI003F770002
MGSKSVFVILFYIVVVSVVNAHFQFEVSNEALDNSLYEEVLDEELCAEQINAIRSNTLLTMYFADAGIRIPKGILEGNTLDMGNYHQCINFNQQLPDSELRGKYCVIRVPLNQTFQMPDLPDLPILPQSSRFDPRLLRYNDETIQNLEQYYRLRKGMKMYTGIVDDDRMIPDNPLLGMQLSLAVCVPRPCTTRQAFDSFLFNVSAVGFDYSDVYCRLPDDKPRVPVDYVAMGVFFVLGVITLISTSYDLWYTFIKKTDPKSLSVIGRSFSVYTNGRRLMTFTSGPDTVECLDGIRALAMAWVLLGHAFTSEISWSNPLDAFMWSTSWQSLWVVGAHYTVDTFFTLSGFLVVYTTVGKLTGKGLLKNLHLFYLNRLLRMFPLLAAGALLEASYLNHMTDGPNWSAVASQVNRCRTTWWSTLLHIQNYVNPQQTCIGQTWYLAIDVQLHILSPIVLVWVLWGKRKLAWTALGTGLLGVLTASTIYNFINKFPPVMMAPGREHEMHNYMFNYYVNTLTRAAPFVVGMIFGYLVRMSKTTLRGVSLIVFWILFFALTTFLMYFNYPINQATWDNQTMSSVYNSFFRSFWAVAIGCLIYACVNGFAGPINWFLSLQVWKLHSRLSYAMYIFHYMLMVAVNFTAIGPKFFSPGAVTFKFLAHYSLCLAVSFLMVLVIDAPFSTLFKLMIGGGAKKPMKKNEDIPIEVTKEDDKKV